MQTQGFDVTYRNTVVTLTMHNVTPHRFSGQVAKAYSVLEGFDRSSPGSVWGCDGVGYDIQLRKGIVEVHKSGIGPRKYKQGLAKLGLVDTGECPVCYRQNCEVC